MEVANEKCLLDRELLIRIDERQRTMSDKFDIIAEDLATHNSEIKSLEEKIASIETSILTLNSSVKGLNEREDYISKKSISWYFLVWGTTFGIISSIVLIYTRLKGV